MNKRKPVGYDAKTGDVIVITTFGEEESWRVVNSYPNHVDLVKNMSANTDLWTVSYEFLIGNEAVYAASEAVAK